ncbi:potassium channel family protein [Lentilactobacillus laojiaonis]|uniref:potassium channel family protein n=1 Tax=Lentilactobacillus laojiaonis TaxID=2883998 RepID=UPI001D0BE1BA|nr:TrkA family potassium uptake protein [Lentilactobacillus laojiaonis]UDM32257.1 TrkA family potassium uptake protein [Lentilactobacillus laojiaonis]
MKKNYAVIGLGLFGGSIVKTLINNNQEVLAIDKDEALVDSYQNIATEAVIADAENEDALIQLGIGSFDNVFIAIADNMEASIMATLLCKELGVKNIICKAENDRHEQVLKKIGADEVIQPEKLIGQQAALKAIDPNILNNFPLTSNMSVSEIKLANQRLGQKDLSGANIAGNFNLKIITLNKNNTDDLQINPSVNTQFDIGDTITVIGKQTDIDDFEKRVM